MSKPFQGPSRLHDDEDGDGVLAMLVYLPFNHLCLCACGSWLCPLEGHTAMDHELLNVYYSE